MGSIRHWFAPGALSDPDVVLYAAGVSVWSRWFIWLVGVFLLAYRPGFWYPGDIEYLALPVLLGMLNGLVHHRLLTNRPVTWCWMLLLSAADIALVTAGIVIGGGFRSFISLAYYPALAVFAVVFRSSRLSLAWTTARLPGDRDRRGMESPERAAQRGLVDRYRQNPRPGDRA